MKYVYLILLMFISFPNKQNQLKNNLYKYNIEITLNTVECSVSRYSKKLPKYVTEFINYYLPIAIKIKKDFGYSIAISLGVGGLESGWGTSHISKTKYNFHGLYGGSKVYKSKQEGFYNFGVFLNKYKRYDCLGKVKDYKEIAYLLHKTGYNPYEIYTTKLIEIIEYAELYKYDLLYL